MAQYPHWLNGRNRRGERLFPGQKDDGGDLVEKLLFLIQGLLTVRQFLDNSVETEKMLGQKNHPNLGRGRMGLVHQGRRRNVVLYWALVSKAWLGYEFSGWKVIMNV